MRRYSLQSLSSPYSAAILEVSARELGEHGFDGASLNHAFAKAGVSRGAASYDFEDKADLLAAAVRRALELLDGLFPDPSSIPADDFWPAVARVYRRSTERLRANPWAVSMARDICRSSHDVHAERVTRSAFAWAGLLAYMTGRMLPPPGGPP